MSAPDLTTPGAVVAFLRRYQEWRRWDGDLDDGPPMPEPREIGIAIDAAIEMLGRLDAAARDVLAERRRQIKEEGWTPLHDDAHDAGDLASAAMGYAQSAACQLSHDGLRLDGTPLFWPWDASWFKPGVPRSDLVKAGALILAEIERLDRATALKSEAKP